MLIDCIMLLHSGTVFHTECRDYVLVAAGES